VKSARPSFELKPIGALRLHLGGTLAHLRQP
jgi:hypothetical protein